MMKIKALSIFLTAAALSTSVAVAHGNEEGGEHAHPEEQPEAAVSATPAEESYALGAGFGRQMQAIEADIDTDAFFRGLKDALSGNDLEYSEDQLRNFSIS
ncbi:MAG: hypothetical protein GWM98_20620, partial [Nitrospinaceae bacterium]|nr:hypothetical protein [Nitrospinaceae bacterium]